MYLINTIVAFNQSLTIPMNQLMCISIIWNAQINSKASHFSSKISSKSRPSKWNSHARSFIRYETYFKIRFAKIEHPDSGSLITSAASVSCMEGEGHAWVMQMCASRSFWNPSSLNATAVLDFGMLYLSWCKDFEMQFGLMLYSWTWNDGNS